MMISHKEEKLFQKVEKVAKSTFTFGIFATIAIPTLYIVSMAIIATNF